MVSPNEIAKKEMWACVSMDTGLLTLMKMDKDSAKQWAATSDGCIEIEDWDEEDGVCIGMKGTEGLRKFAGLVSSRLNGGGRPRKNISVGGEIKNPEEITTWEAT